MNERIQSLRSLEPKKTGSASYRAILEAAAGLFQQFPAEAIALRDILSISGVSNQTLYNYFPAGRDDVALVLFDHFQRAMVLDFANNNRALEWGALAGKAGTTRALSASFARASFSYLKANHLTLSALLDYLNRHNLTAVATHSLELEEALRQEMLLRYGSRVSPLKVPLIARLSVRVVREVVEVAMAHPEFPLGAMESNARKLLRTLLPLALKGDDSESGEHRFLAYAPPPLAIKGASISPSRKQAILSRMLKRKSPA
jgi:AcrR family transcriptional regulator